jgi:molybdate transport repressor ModE-like protein
MKMRIDIAVDILPGVTLRRRDIFLLEQIRKTGSLSHAAHKLKISYKTAWKLIAKLNTLGAAPFTQACAGGVDGGKTTLTPYGLKIVAQYRKVFEKLRQLARQEERQNPF